MLHACRPACQGSRRCSRGCRWALVDRSAWPGVRLAWTCRRRPAWIQRVVGYMPSCQGSPCTHDTPKAHPRLNCLPQIQKMAKRLGCACGPCCDCCDLVPASAGMACMAETTSKATRSTVQRGRAFCCCFAIDDRMISSRSPS